MSWWLTPEQLASLQPKVKVVGQKSKARETADALKGTPYYEQARQRADESDRIIRDANRAFNAVQVANQERTAEETRLNTIPSIADTFLGARGVPSRIAMSGFRSRGSSLLTGAFSSTRRSTGPFLAPRDFKPGVATGKPLLPPKPPGAYEPVAAVAPVVAPAVTAAPTIPLLPASFMKTGKPLLQGWRPK